MALLLPTIVRAEYRVFQYYVKSKFETPSDVNSYLITSTLDPVSYMAYHGGSDSIKIDMVRSWKCLGFTGQGMNTCPSPYAKAKKELSKVD